MLNLKDVLREDIAAGITAASEAGELSLSPSEDEPLKVVVAPSGREGQGDYASPVALTLAKGVKMQPLDIVEAIVKHMPKKEYVGRIMAVEPGFLNVWINPGWMTARLDNVIEEDLCAAVNVGEGRTVNLEFISANPTGPMTLGNIRTAFSVDTLANVLTCAGFAVTREYYINDYGGQIVRLGESVLRRILQAAGEEVEYGEELYQGGYIVEVAARVAEARRENEGKEFVKEDLADMELMERVGASAAELLLTEIKRVVDQKLHIEFDVWSSERALRESGAVDVVLDELRAAGQIYQKDEAEYVKTSAFGDRQDWVVVKGDGEYTYFLPDIAYHKDKYEREYDLIFTFVGADHLGHVGRMKAAMTMLGKDADKMTFQAAQFMRVLRGGKPVKLSKRAGEVYSPQELIGEVGYDAARFFMVLHQLSTHMDFDLDLAKERSEKNPVYYVQYAYVRLQSILRQAKERGVIDNVGVTFDLTDSPALTHSLELKLMQQLYRFPEVIAGIAEEFDVHDLAYYAKDLAKSVHVFYRHVPVLGQEDDELQRSRLQLVLASQVVLGKVLDLLGISKPDVM